VTGRAWGIRLVRKAIADTRVSRPAGRKSDTPVNENLLLCVIDAHNVTIKPTLVIDEGRRNVSSVRGPRKCDNDDSVAIRVRGSLDPSHACDTLQCTETWS